MKKSQNGNELFSNMRISMWEAHASFEIYRAIQYSNGIDLHGKDVAERNASVINRYKEFFAPVMQSLYAKSTLGLWQFFDKEHNLGYKALLKVMKPITNHQVFEDLKKEIEDKLSKHNRVTEKVRQIRHEEIAHVSIATDRNNLDVEYELKIEEVDELFRVTQEIFNLMAHHFESSTTMFPLNDEEARREVDAVLRDLHLGFEEYKKIIHRKYGPTREL